jgi:lipopolysaccharide export system permease protein
MKTIDRYVLGLFVKSLAVSYLSLAGLLIVVDAFGNLDEFLISGREQGNLLVVLAGYYGVRMLSFFDSTSAVLALLGAVFTVAWMRRTREMTALMVAGVPQRRVVMPVILGAAVVSLLAATNRELLLPQLRDRLSLNAQDLAGEAPRPIAPRYDPFSDILIGGRGTMAKRREIDQPVFRLPDTLSRLGRQLTAHTATYQPSTDDRPGGYLMHGVTEPTDLSKYESAELDGRPVILMPSDTPWLAADQCFVASDVDFEQLASADAWRRYSSTAELLAYLHKPGPDAGADVRLTVHARFLQPLLDMTLLLVGLPLVLSRQDRNVFVAAGLCVFVVAGFFAVVTVSHALGMKYLISPALAAWCPLVVMVPAASAMSTAFRQ